MEPLSNKEKFLKALREWVYHKFDNQKKAALRLNISTSYLSAVLSGTRGINDEFKRKLSTWGFPPKYWVLIESEQTERKKRRDEFLLLLEQKDNVILDYKHLFKINSEWLDKVYDERDEAKRIGGLGTCGREFCCASFLSNFKKITTQLASEQNLASSFSKLSGPCGKLKCCLSFEPKDGNPAEGLDHAASES